MIAQQNLVQTELKEEALITGEELAAMGDLGQCELVEGRVVKLSPTKMPYGRYEFEMARLLGNFVEKHNLGVVKIKEYFEIGVTAVLIVEPEEQTMALYRSPTDIQEFTLNDTLALADILPDFNLPLARLWVNPL